MQKSHTGAKGQEAVSRRFMKSVQEIYDCNVLRAHKRKPRRKAFGRATNVRQPNALKVESQLRSQAK